MTSADNLKATTYEGDANYETWGPCFILGITPHCGGLNDHIGEGVNDHDVKGILFWAPGGSPIPRSMKKNRFSFCKRATLPYGVGLLVLQVSDAELTKNRKQRERCRCIVFPGLA